MTNTEVGRNEPCPCGSGKKYKRCCGVSAAPKLTTPKAVATPPIPEAAGFDPSKMDPQMMAQMAQALQRLPKGQIQRLQSLMKRAMAGKDVSREAAELESMLPPGFQDMVRNMNLPGVSSGDAVASTSGEAPMSVEKAKELVAQAAAAGKISEEQAKSLLSLENPAETEKSSGFSKLWKKVTGKG